MRGCAIKPVPRRVWPTAVRFLVGRADKDPIAEGRAQALEQWIHSKGRKQVHLWWARQDGCCQAVAMVIRHPGKTGMLFHSSTDVAGGQADRLAELVGRLTHWTLENGLTLVQSLPDPSARNDIAMLQAAGMRPIARLVYMNGTIQRTGSGSPQGPLTWRSYEQYSRQELGRTLQSTYEGSLDCPALRGRREIQDVIASHEANGVFCPQTWWLVEHHSQVVGCVLLNDSPKASAAELVYLGVYPAYRGQGFGRCMLRYAAEQSHLRGREVLTLAVDADNHFAMRLYLAEGFQQVGCRLAYMALR